MRAVLACIALLLALVLAGCSSRPQPETVSKEDMPLGGWLPGPPSRAIDYELAAG